MPEIRATMAGTIWKILVEEGERVTAGQDVVILESMKMEIPIATDIDGLVEKVEVVEGQFVGDGEVLLRLVHK